MNACDAIACFYCGKSKSRSRKPFTLGTVAQHEATCQRNPEHVFDDGFELYDHDHIDPDEPDGVYWAMVAEAEGAV